MTTITYELRVHRNEIDIGYFYHTGFNLLKKIDDGNGNISYEVQKLDLLKTGMWNSLITISNPITVESATSLEFITNPDPKTVTLLYNNDALETFNRIKFNALLINFLGNTPGGLLDYDLEGPNCNTWTNYINQKFIGKPIFDMLGVSRSGIQYTGSGSDFLTSNTGDDNKSASIIDTVNDMILCRNISLSAGYPDFSWNADGSLNINLQDTLYKVCSSYDDTVVNKTDNITILAGSGSDRIINYGENVIIESGDGDDVITGGDFADEIYAGDGDDMIYASKGDDLLYGGEGDDTYIFRPGHDHDTIEDNEGSNEVRLTALYPEYRGTRLANGDTVLFGTRYRDTITIKSGSTVDTLKFTEGSYDLDDRIDSWAGDVASCEGGNMTIDTQTYVFSKEGIGTLNVQTWSVGAVPLKVYANDINTIVLENYTKPAGSEICRHYNENTNTASYYVRRENDIPQLMRECA